MFVVKTNRYIQQNLSRIGPNPTSVKAIESQTNFHAQAQLQNWQAETWTLEALDSDNNSDHHVTGSIKLHNIESRFLCINVPFRNERARVEVLSHSVCRMAYRTSELFRLFKTAGYWNSFVQFVGNCLSSPFEFSINVSSKKKIILVL